MRDGDFEYRKLKSGINIIGYSGFDSYIEIPKYIDNLPVTYIGKSAFENYRTLINIKIPNSVTKISDRAFKNCGLLTSIEIPNSVTEIGDWAFADCNSLTTIEIPDSLTKIGDWAFWYCRSLITIKIPDSVTKIGDCVFEHCDLLTEIKFPSSIKDLYVFKNFLTDYADKIKYYDKSQSTVKRSTIQNAEDFLYKKIGERAIAITGYIGSQSRIKIPKYIEDLPVTEIGHSAFSGCEFLKKVTIPDGITRINDRAFYRCYLLKDMEIPDSVTYIGSQAFYCCESLKRINLPLNIKFIGKEAFMCSSDFTVSVPEDLKNSSVLKKFIQEFQSHPSLRYMDLGELSNSSYGYNEGVKFSDDINQIIEKNLEELERYMENAPYKNKTTSTIPRPITPSPSILESTVPKPEPQKSIIKKPLSQKSTVQKPVVQNPIVYKPILYRIENLKNTSNISLDSRNLLEQLEYLLKSDDYLEKLNAEVLSVIDEISKKQRIANLTYLLNSSSEYATVNWYFSTEINEKLVYLVDKIRNLNNYQSTMRKPKLVQEVIVPNHNKFEPKDNPTTYQNTDEGESFFSSGLGCMTIFLGIMLLIGILSKLAPFIVFFIIVVIMSTFNK